MSSSDGNTPTVKKVREFEDSVQMSDHEALMWNIEKDPWLSPSGASVTLLDQPVDFDLFRRQIRFGAANMPRLYQRVVPSFGALSTPSWIPDDEFDFDYHVRQMDLPAPGTDRQLFDLAAQLYSEPMDRTRPLWRFVAIGGLEGGRGAVYSLFHHAISDGIGQLRMAEMYQQVSRDEEPRPEVDLEAVVAAAVVASQATSKGSTSATGFRATVVRSATQITSRNLSLTRRALGAAAIWPADPRRPIELAKTVIETVRSTSGTAGDADEDAETTSGGSPLWAHRSRHRHLEYVAVPLEDLKSAAKASGASINDAFIAGITEAAVRYHREHGVEVKAFNTSFVVSLRSDNRGGGNSFTPVPVRVSASLMTPSARMAAVHATAERAKDRVGTSGGLSGLSGILNLLPTSVVTRAARDRAAKIDFATSNLRGAPFPLYCAGGKVEATVCMGPLAGTALNVTALSYNGSFDIGVFIDPTAVSDPAAFRAHLEASFKDLIAGVPDTATPAAKRSAAKKPSPPKKAASKALPRKKATKKPTVRRAMTKKASANAAPRNKTTSKKAMKKKAAAKKTAAKRSPTKAPTKKSSPSRPSRR